MNLITADNTGIKVQFDTNFIPSHHLCISLPFYNCCYWAFILHSDKIWIFWAVILYALQTKGPPKTLLLIITVVCVKRRRETVTCHTHLCCTSTRGPIASGFCAGTALPSYISVKKLLCLPLHRPPCLSHPNLLLWVSAHGVLNPSVSNSCWGKGGIERLNESLQTPEGIPHVSLPPTHASVFDPLCFPTQLSPNGCKRVPMPTYIQTSLESMVAAELISVV